MALKKKGHGNRWLLLGMLLVATAAGGGCGRKPEGKTIEPQTVAVSQPVRSVKTSYEEFTGTLQAVATDEVHARVTGYLEEVYFQPGAEVEKGERLFLIDPGPYQDQFDMAEAKVLEAKAQVAATQAKVVEAEAQLDLNEKKLARDLEVAKTPGAVSGQQLDVSRAAVAESKAAVDAAKANVAALEASVKAAEANVDICRRKLGWTTVTSPIAGRIDRNLLTEGNMVTADMTVLTNIVISDAVYAYFNIDERTVQDIQKMVRDGKLHRNGTVPISLRLQSEKEFTHDGYLDFFGNKLDTGTGTLQVRGIFENPDRALKPGFFVRVRVPVDTPRERLLVPEPALGTDQGQKYLLVVNDQNKVEYRKVKLGLTDHGMRSVEEGLKADEWFIVRGLQRVRPDEVVKPEKLPQKAPQT